MNERIKELALESGLAYKQPDGRCWIDAGFVDADLERFAELVRQDEREANVKLLEDFAKTNMVPAKDTWRMGLIAGANALRARGEK